MVVELVDVEKHSPDSSWDWDWATGRSPMAHAETVYRGTRM